MGDLLMVVVPESHEVEDRPPMPRDQYLESVEENQRRPTECANGAGGEHLGTAIFSATPSVEEP
jgi:hypothetical protein